MIPFSRHLIITNSNGIQVSIVGKGRGGKTNLISWTISNSLPMEDFSSVILAKLVNRNMKLITYFWIPERFSEMVLIHIGHYPNAQEYYLIRNIQLIASRLLLEINILIHTKF